MYALLLNGVNVDLAKEEVLALAKNKKFFLDGKLLLINEKLGFERLAYTNKVYKLLGTLKDMDREISKINFQKYFKTSFRVRIIKIPSNLEIKYNESNLGSFIWKKLKKPKVDLDTPKTKFDFIFTKNNIFVCLDILKMDKKFVKERDAKFRPGFHPSSMNALFAKALVNLSSVKPGEKLLDPFCGVGGILVEAGLLKCKLLGYDIDELMVKKCMKNLKFYKISSFKVKLGDALESKDRVHTIVTDPPYGRHSSLHGKSINFLYNKFIGVAYKNLNKNRKMVIVMPEKLDVNIGKFKLRAKILHRIHKTLTRKILVLEKLNS